MDQNQNLGLNLSLDIREKETDRQAGRQSNSQEKMESWNLNEARAEVGGVNINPPPGTSVQGSSASPWLLPWVRRGLDLQCRVHPTCLPAQGSGLAADGTQAAG